MRERALAGMRQPGIEQHPSPWLQLSFARVEAIAEAVALGIAEHDHLLERDRAGSHPLGVDHRLAAVVGLAQPQATLGHCQLALLVAHVACLQAFVAAEQGGGQGIERADRSEEHTSELQSLMRISYAVFCLKKKKYTTRTTYKTSKP